jgi:hypothetical protein
VSADSVASPAWSGNQNILTTFYTSSLQTNNSTANYYIDVYKDNPQLTSSADVQFSIAYADKFGLGATPYNSSITGSTPTSTLYGQMRTLLLEDENSDFYFGSGNNIVTGSDFYIININRSHYKEKLLPGAWELSIDSPDGSDYNGMTLTDNSNTVSLPEYYGTQRVYQIGKGSNGKADFSTCPSGSYGLFFPDTNLILLNSKALDLSDMNGGINLGTTRTYSSAHNELKLLKAIQNPISANYFQMMSEETITSNYVFVRARNSELNYSENPSFISGSTGEVIHDSYIYNPQTYITTVGLYNDSNELMAVSKLSKPLKKDFSSEALLRIRLDF